MQKADITPLISEESSVIENIGREGIKVSGHYWSDDILVTGYKVYSWQQKELGEFLSQTNIESAIDYVKSLLNSEETAILLVGGGNDQPDLTFTVGSNLFYDNRVSVDIMTTPAACRTFNVLTSEDRKVFALLKQL